MDKNVSISDKEIKKLLDFIFLDAQNLYKKLASNGWENSKYIRFFHPTARQQFEEDNRITERLNSLTKKARPDEYEGRETDFEQESG